MPFFERDGARIAYDLHGSGFPILTFAPGGMRSAAAIWANAPFDPRQALTGGFQVIAMDQRNAGRSSAPVSADDGWQTYAEDHVALLDHLGIERCHVLGGCIGSSYCTGVIQHAPGRVAAAVLQNPIGLHQNRDAFFQMFDAWKQDLAQRLPDVTEPTWDAFRSSMYGGDFTFNASREFFKACRTPLLVLMGSDLYHPEPISREIAALAPDVRLVERWKEPPHTDAAVASVLDFLRSHS